MFNYERLHGKIVEALKPHMTGKYESQARRRDKVARRVADAVVAELCEAAPKEALVDFFMGFSPGPPPETRLHGPTYLTVTRGSGDKLHYVLYGDRGSFVAASVVAHRLLPPLGDGDQNEKG